MVKKKIKKFWNNRSHKKNYAGSNTLSGDMLETNYLSGLIKKNSTILDAGCGNGIFFSRLYKKIKYRQALGIDYSEGMIYNAQKRNLPKTSFIVDDITKLNNTKKLNIRFDYIITKRSLINLSNSKKQIEVIKNLSLLLKKKGKLYCCECSQDALDNINSFRKKLKLSKIDSPWHNSYLKDKKIQNIKTSKLKFLRTHEFTSSFYFISRILNAYITKKNKKNFFDKALNEVALKMDQGLIKGFSQNKIFEFEKK
tara:strand:+ start:657 stop:1418 length:762 start_codon:yes stop_codon:yes gene_type:complete